MSPFWSTDCRLQSKQSNSQYLQNIIFQKLAFFIDLKEKKEERSLPELILPEDYQKGRREDGKKNVSAAIRVIFDNPDDCLFIIGEYFYHLGKSWKTHPENLPDLPF